MKYRLFKKMWKCSIKPHGEKTEYDWHCWDFFNESANLQDRLMSKLVKHWAKFHKS